MTCNPEQRDRLRDAAWGLDGLDCVESTTLVEPADARDDRWRLEAVLVPSAGGVPGNAMNELAAADATLRAVARQGDHWTAVAVA